MDVILRQADALFLSVWTWMAEEISNSEEKKHDEEKKKKITMMMKKIIESKSRPFLNRFRTNRINESEK